jgi:LmbE family N-acetylglucosaminyl deacetylase
VTGLDDHASLRSDYLLVRRPQLDLRENGLCFVSSKRPLRVLSAEELKLWNLMQREMTVGAVREACGEHADALIHDFLQSEFCELLEPPIPNARRRVLVIEPHADDAALSIGGTMWLRRFDCAFIVATMGSRSNHLDYYGLGRVDFDIGKVTDLRRGESELFARMVGGEHLSVGLTDAALRYRNTNWTSDFYLNHQMSISVRISRNADDHEREEWLEAARRLLAEIPSAEVWVPLGGPHTDHRLTVDACFGAFVSDPSLIEGRVIRVYQEVPYAARYPRYMNEAFAALQRAGAVLEPELTPINEVFEQKLRLSSVYASQNIQDMRADIEASARSHGSAVGTAELLWTVRALPDRIGPSGMTLAGKAERDQEEAVVKWVSTNKEAERVRVMLAMPTGRWAADLELLRSAFPKARFEIYVAPTAVAEVAETPSPRIDVRKVAGGALPWILLSLRFAAAMKSLPTLFLVADRRLRLSRVLSKLWPRSDTLVLSSMDRLASALRARRDP